MAQRIPKDPSPFTLDQIVEDIGKIFEMTPEKIRSKEKSDAVVSVREILLYVTAWLDKVEGGTTPMGIYLNKHRTAITKQRRKIANYIDVEEPFFMANLKKYKRESKVWLPLIQSSPKKHLSYADTIESVWSMSPVRDGLGRR